MVSSEDGFGEYLHNFFSEYKEYFDDYQTEHALVYTEIHKKFAQAFEENIDQWLQGKGLTEDDLDALTLHLQCCPS